MGAHSSHHLQAQIRENQVTCAGARQEGSPPASKGSHCGQNSIVGRSSWPSGCSVEIWGHRHPPAIQPANSRYAVATWVFSPPLGQILCPGVFAYPYEQTGNTRAGPEAAQAAARASPTYSLRGPHGALFARPEAEQTYSPQATMSRHCSPREGASPESSCCFLSSLSSLSTAPRNPGEYFIASPKRPVLTLTAGTWPFSPILKYEQNSVEFGWAGLLYTASVCDRMLQSSSAPVHTIILQWQGNNRRWSDKNTSKPDTCHKGWGFCGRQDCVKLTAELQSFFSCKSVNRYLKV